MWRRRISALSATKVATYILFAFSLLMAGVTAVMATNSFDVLQDWKLTINDTRVEAGERVIVESTYKKIRNAGGEAIRYLECRNRDGVWLRYELNRRAANRKATGNDKGGTGIDVTMRDDVPDLPAQCKVTVNICYDTFLPWYCHPESQDTSVFTLYPKASPSADGGPGGSPETSQTPVPASLSSDPSSSVALSTSPVSPNPTTPARTEQSNSSQNNESEPPSSSPATPVQEGVTGIPLVDSVIRFLGGGN